MMLPTLFILDCFVQKLCFFFAPGPSSSSFLVDEKGPFFSLQTSLKFFKFTSLASLALAWPLHGIPMK